MTDPIRDFEHQVQALNQTIEKQATLLYDAKKDVAILHQSMRRLAQKLYILEVESDAFNGDK